MVSWNQKKSENNQEIIQEIIRETIQEIMQAKILTVSDGVINKTRQDTSGEELKRTLVSANFEVVEHKTCADGKKNVKKALKKMAADFQGLIVTTGGTGFGPRDLTPEGTLALIQREAQGIHEAMRLVNPLGRLSRGVAGTYRQCLILNVPGSPKGAQECLAAVMDVIPHALALLAGEKVH